MVLLAPLDDAPAGCSCTAISGQMPITRALCSVCKVCAVILSYQGEKSTNLKQTQLSWKSPCLPAQSPAFDLQHDLKQILHHAPTCNPSILYAGDSVSKLQQNHKHKHLRHSNTSTNSLKTKKTAGTQ